jgi:DNA-binding transcriptional regulator YiaG
VTQIAFAQQLGVSLETYRRWDADRRTPRHEILVMANALALRCNPLTLLPLGPLARLVGVHIRTLHAAAKDGRLRVTYDTRTTFRRLRTRATLADAEHFKREYFDKAMWPAERPARMAWETIPSDCADRIRQMRLDLGLTLGQFATRVGAARKAVVYQWESGKRCPSPVFWQRIQQLRPTSGSR